MDSNLRNIGIPSIANSKGIYSRYDIDRYKFDKFARWGFLDPYHYLSSTTEYLFFTRPDLHIMEGKNLNPELKNEAFFIELYERYPYVINWLQYSYNNDPMPFIPILTTMVNSNLDLPDISSTNIDTPTNIFGTNYEYRGSGEASDDNYQFSLEFKDSKYLEVYMFFKAYEEYERLKSRGRVSPPDRQKYTIGKRLHDQIGIYKFLVGEDGENITFYAYACGVIPNSVPRSAFSNNAFDNGITFSVDFKAAFILDTDPRILRNFNYLVSPLYNQTTDILAIFDKSIHSAATTWARCPFIYSNKNNMNEYYGFKSYKLKWRD